MNSKQINTMIFWIKQGVDIIESEYDQGCYFFDYLGYNSSVDEVYYDPCEFDTMFRDIAKIYTKRAKRPSIERG